MDVLFYTPVPIDDGVGGWALALAAAVETDEEIGRAWSAAIDTLATQIDRAYYGDDPSERIPATFQGGGRFRSPAQVIFKALREWFEAGRDRNTDPLERFDRPQLMSATKARGLKPRRGATEPELRSMLRADAVKSLGGSQPRGAAPSGPQSAKKATPGAEYWWDEVAGDFDAGEVDITVRGASSEADARAQLAEDHDISGAKATQVIAAARRHGVLGVDNPDFTPTRGRKAATKAMAAKKAAPSPRPPIAPQPGKSAPRARPVAHPTPARLRAHIAAANHTDPPALNTRVAAELDRQAQLAPRTAMRLRRVDIAPPARESDPRVWSPPELAIPDHGAAYIGPGDRMSDGVRGPAIRFHPKWREHPTGPAAPASSDFPPGLDADLTVAIFAHEFGHHVVETFNPDASATNLGTVGWTQQQSDRLFTPLAQELGVAPPKGLGTGLAVWRYENRDAISDRVSPHAGAPRGNLMEMLSDIWAEWSIRGEDSRPLARRIGPILRDMAEETLTPEGEAGTPPLSRAMDADGAKALAARLDAATRGGRRGEHGDELLHGIAVEQGWTAKPTRADPATVDRLVADGQPQLWRGVETPAEATRLLTGEPYFGDSVYGSGINTSQSRLFARQYGDHTTRMTLAPGSRVVDLDAVQREQATFLAGDVDASQRLVFADTSRFAAAKGYDAIRVRHDSGADGSMDDPDWLDTVARQAGYDSAADLPPADLAALREGRGDHYIVLNRGALVVDRTSAPTPRKDPAKKASRSIREPTVPVLPAKQHEALKAIAIAKAQGSVDTKELGISSATRGALVDAGYVRRVNSTSTFNAADLTESGHDYLDRLDDSGQIAQIRRELEEDSATLASYSEPDRFGRVSDDPLTRQLQSLVNQRIVRGRSKLDQARKAHYLRMGGASGVVAVAPLRPSDPRAGAEAPGETDSKPVVPTKQAVPTAEHKLIGRRVDLKPSAGSYATFGTVRSVLGDGAAAVYEIEVIETGQRRTLRLPRGEFTPVRAPRTRPAPPKATPAAKKAVPATPTPGSRRVSRADVQTGDTVIWTPADGGKPLRGRVTRPRGKQTVLTVEWEGGKVERLDATTLPRGTFTFESTTPDTPSAREKAVPATPPKPKAPEPRDIADQVNAQQSEADIIRYLSGGGFTAAKLKKVAEELDIDVPANVKAKTALQLHIAEKVARGRGLPGGFPETPGLGKADAAEELSPGELIAMRDVRNLGVFADGGWLRRADVPQPGRQHLDALVEKGWLQKHTVADGELFRIDPRSVGTQQQPVVDGGALVGDVLPAQVSPSPRLSLLHVRRGAVLKGYRDPRGGPFGNVPEGGSAEPDRVVRVRVQRLDAVDEGGNPATGLRATHRRIVGVDVDTGRLVRSDVVSAGSLWDWELNPEGATSGDLEGELAGGVPSTSPAITGGLGKADAAAPAAPRVQSRNLFQQGVDAEDLARSVQRESTPDGPDLTLAAIADRQGFAGRPQVVSSAEFDRLAAESTTRRGLRGQVVFRGVRPTGGRTAESIHGQLAVGAYEARGSIWGAGIHTTPRVEVADDYASMAGGVGGVGRYLIHPQAVGVDSRRLSLDHDKFLASLPADSIARTVFADPGRYAAARGYDYIGTPSGPVVLNRTALIADRAVYRPGSLRPSRTGGTTRAKHRSGDPTDAALSTDPRVREQAARDRQAKLDTARNVAESLTELDELRANQATPRAMEARLRARGRLGNLPPDLVDDLVAAGTSGDNDRINTTLDRIATQHGLTRTTAPAGGVEPFNRTRHDMLGGAPQLADGAPAHIVRPGYSATVDGEPVTVHRAVVTEADPTTVGKAANPDRVERLADGLSHIAGTSTGQTTAETQQAMRDMLAGADAQTLRAVADEVGVAIPDPLRTADEIREHIVAELAPLTLPR